MVPLVLCGSTGAGVVPLFYVVVQEQEWFLCFMW